MSRHDDDDHNVPSNIGRMLDNEHTLYPRTRGALTALFRKIRIDFKINRSRWDTYMDRYLDNPKHDLPKRGKERSTVRGNLNKQLNNDPMTFKNFMKALSFVGADYVRFEVHITRRKKTTVHGVDLIMENTDDESDD